MKISDFLLINLFILLLLFNISNITLGYWSLIVYILVAIGSFLFINYITNKNKINNNNADEELSNELPDLWRFKIENLCSSWLELNNEFNDNQAKICLQCHNQNCVQHNPDLFIYQQPWKHLFIEKNINNKLEELFEILLNKYTSSWIHNVTCKSESIFMIFKQLISIVLSSLIIRFKKRIKLDEFILNNIPSHLFQHLEMYVHGKRRAKSANMVEESVLKQYNQLIHSAVINADNEMKYFKAIADIIIYTTLPPKKLNCDVTRSFLNEFLSCCIISPLMDILTDPDKINIVLIYLLNPNECDSATVSLTEQNSFEKVPFLKNFSMTKYKMEDNFFGINVKQILNDDCLLDLFRKYAYEECFINYLEFIIEVDLFLNEITNPDLTDIQRKELHNLLKKIYEIYFEPNGKNFIYFDPFITLAFKKVI